MNTRYAFLTLPLSLLTLLTAGCASADPVTFASPDEAVRALLDASDDPDLAERLLGPGGFAMLRSGDEVSDREDIEAVRELIQQKVAFTDAGAGRKVALLGSDGWELPIPLVALEGRWAFDVEAGRDEIQSRRVGRNELLTIDTLRALVEAQREYSAESRDGNPPAYARKLWSSEGKHDGLYWPAGAGSAESPMGPLIAEAFQEGYARPQSKQAPYHGYFFRMLPGQGTHAPGGARSYLHKNGLLTGGFAVLAWPASHGNSGVMTFLVNQQGIVFQKDLGPDTDKLVSAITAYDPDLTWAPTRD